MCQQPEQILGHCFADQQLARQALTHRSYLNESRTSGSGYQQLEFLGDAVLGMVLADLLLQRFPQLPEGDLSRLRASLADQTCLAQLAGDAGLGTLVRLGKGAEQEGGRHNPSILADLFEACIGAIYRDAGFAAAAAVLERIYQPLLDQAAAARIGLYDAKSSLQEQLAALQMAPPVYTLLVGQDNGQSPLFCFAVSSGDQLLGQGEGRSKKAAQQAAARQALQQLATAA